MTRWAKFGVLAFSSTCLLLSQIGCKRKSAVPPALQAAFEVAKQSGRPILVDFYAEWCPLCKQLDQSLHSREANEVVANHYVFVRLNGDKADVETFMKSHNIVGLPALIVFNSEGEFLERVVLGGHLKYDDVSGLAQRLAQAGQGVTLLDSLLKKWSVLPADVNRAKVGLAIAVEYVERGDEKNAIEWAKRLDRLENGGSQNIASEAFLSIADDLYLRGLKKTEKAREWFGYVRQEYPATYSAAKSAFRESELDWSEGKKSGIEKRFKDLMSTANPHALYQYAKFCRTYKWNMKDALEQLLQIVPQDPGKKFGMWEEVALLYHQTGQCAKATEAAQNALREDPDHWFTKEVSAKVRTCQIVGL